MQSHGSRSMIVDQWAQSGIVSSKIIYLGLTGELGSFSVVLLGLVVRLRSLSWTTWGCKLSNGRGFPRGKAKRPRASYCLAGCGSCRSGELRGSQPGRPDYQVRQRRGSQEKRRRQRPLPVNPRRRACLRELWGKLGPTAALR